MSKFGKIFEKYWYSNYADVSQINFIIFLQCFWSSYCALHPVLKKQLKKWCECRSRLGLVFARLLCYGLTELWLSMIGFLCTLLGPR